MGLMDPASAWYTIRINGHLGATMQSAFSFFGSSATWFIAGWWTLEAFPSSERSSTNVRHGMTPSSSEEVV